MDDPPPTLMHNLKARLPILLSPIAQALCLFFLALLVFWPGVSGGFLFDDYHNIVTNAHVQIKELTAASLWRGINAYSGGTRQLAMLTFTLNAYWAGLEPWAYKVTGLVVHATNAVLVFFLAQRIFTLAAGAGTAQLIAPPHRTAAAALALVWALHPLQVSSALYIVQRMETLCFSFLFIALLLYLQARQQQISSGRSRKLLWLGMALAWLAAWLCKENAVLLPLFCLGLEASVLGFAAARPAQQRLWRSLYLAGGVLAVLVFIVWAWPHYYSTELHAGRDFNTAQRLWTQCRVLLLYLQQILLPLPETIYFYYDDLPLSNGWLQPPSTLVAALVLLTMLALAVFWCRRFPLFSLGIFWFFAAHFLTSNIIALEMVFEHRNYFALLGILLVCAEGIARLPVRDGPGIKYLGVAVLVLGIAFLGGLRAATWGNVLLLATDMSSKNLNSARAGMDLGVAYYELSGGDANSPFYQFAATQFDRVAAMPHASTQADVNLILMASGDGLPSDMLNLENVWQRYLQRLQTLPWNVETRTSVWSLLQERMKGKHIQDEYLQKALIVTLQREVQPDYRLAQVAEYYLKILNNVKEAKFTYEQAIQKALLENNENLIQTIIGDMVESGHHELAIDFTLIKNNLNQ